VTTNSRSPRRRERPRDSVVFVMVRWRLLKHHPVGSLTGFC
jgi:hypothetical protein